MADALPRSVIGPKPPQQELLAHAGLGALTQDGSVHANRAAVYAYIVRYVMQRRMPPTIREVGQALGLRSKNTVAYHLNQLYRRGLLVHRKRCVGMTLSQWVAGHPVLGTVVHGEPRSYLGILETGLVQPSTPYVLLVQDHALVAEHLCAGDALMVEPSPQAKLVGGLVIARSLERGSTLHLCKVGEDGQLVGLAAQPPLAPCELSHAHVQGVVSSMVRLL